MTSVDSPQTVASLGFALGAALLMVAVACGPTQSTTGISAAESSLEQARVHDAETYSPYEYERAVHYLYKAKYHWGYSDFEVASDYAREARRSADAALNNAREAPWRGHPIYGFDERPSDVDDLEDKMESTDDLDQLEDLDEID